MTQPNGPENVRLLFEPDGTPFPVELEYRGVETQGSEAGIHIWDVITPYDQPLYGMLIEKLPERTAIRVPFDRVRTGPR